LAEALGITSTIVMGLLAGSLLLEGAILIPYWRRMNPDDFFRLHGTFGPALFKYFAPLTTATVSLSLAAALVDMRDGLRIAAAILCFAILGIFFVYFRKANASFADRSLSPEDLPAELTRWTAWHWLRTALLVLAFALAVVSSS